MMPDAEPADPQNAAGSTRDLRPFIPIWTRASALAIGTLLVVGTAYLIFVVPNTDLARAQFTPANVVGILLVIALCVTVLWRLGGVRADVTTGGIRVRNIIHTRQIEWAEIVNLRFTTSDAWVFADLTDGTQIAILGIQQSDGKRGRAEAQRLSALVTKYGTSQEPH